jgi:hypothetical protein
VQPSAGGADENSPQFQLRGKAQKPIKLRRGGRQNRGRRFGRPSGACEFYVIQTYFQVVPLGRSLPPQAAGGKAERFVKFRPRTPLREIIQLSE